MSSFENSISNIMSEGVNHLRVTRHDCNANLRSVSHFLYTKHLQRWPVDISVLLCLLDTIITSMYLLQLCVATAPVKHKFRQYSEDSNVKCIATTEWLWYRTRTHGKVTSLYPCQYRGHWPAQPASRRWQVQRDKNNIYLERVCPWFNCRQMKEVKRQEIPKKTNNQRLEVTG